MTVSPNADFNVWIRGFHPSDGVGPRLLCLPHLGGAANFFYSISTLLAPSIEVLAVQYPGRQDRYHEPAFTSIDELADALHKVLETLDDRPLTLFGHSMGALIGFELAQRLCRVGREPAVLFVSARGGPSASKSPTADWVDDAVLIGELKELGGAEASLLDNQEVLEAVLPTLRRDYQALDSYQYKSDKPLTCPIVAMIGAEDPKVTVEKGRAWASETSAGFDLAVFPGGHFYLTEHLAKVTDFIARSVRSSTALNSERVRRGGQARHL